MKQVNVTCGELLERYSELVDERLPGSEAMRLWTHVRSCPSCGRYHRVLRGGVSVLRDLPAPAPPSDFMDGVRSRIRREAGGSSSRWTLLVLLLAVALAVALAVVGSGAAGHAAAGPEPTSVPDPAASHAWTQRVESLGSWPALASPDLPSYSPLIVGPPMYRAADGHTSAARPEPCITD